MAKTKELKKIRSITIQPASPEADPLLMPYPYHIEPDGKVARQDFWKGRPLKLLGFNKTNQTGDISLMRSEWMKNPKRAIGMFPVFANKGDEWTTSRVAISDVHYNYEK